MLTSSVVSDTDYHYRAFKGKVHILGKLLHYKIYALVRLPYELLNKCCLSLVVGQICNELGIS